MMDTNKEIVIPTVEELIDTCYHKDDPPTMLEIIYNNYLKRLNKENKRLKENGDATLRERNYFEDCLNEVGDKAKDLYAENKRLFLKIGKAKNYMAYISLGVGSIDDLVEAAKKAWTELEKNDQ